MANSKKLQSALVWLVMASLCGLVGLVVVYHYANFRRPIQQFAIVVDAGSTQTRSSLFTLNLDSNNLVAWMSNNNSKPNEIQLSQIIQVRQVSSCINGGPLTALQTSKDAKQLLDRCLPKFTKHIKYLDFLSSGNEAKESIEDASMRLDSAEIEEKMSLLNHRVNSVTHLHLGATAGMRSLSQLNESRANEKIHWIDEAIKGISTVDRPHINKGFVGMIEGSDEAAFGWTSVNFVCDNFVISKNHAKVVNSETDKQIRKNLSTSIGTLELGGASAQMAFRLPKSWSNETVKNSGFDGQLIELFNERYELATRSDLCLGMSQAVLRTHYMLLRDGYIETGRQTESALEMENPCLQQASRVSFTGDEMGSLLTSACLAPNKTDLQAVSMRNYLSTKRIIRFVGLGDYKKCNNILTNLIEPYLCKHYFALCPVNKNNLPPPKDMSFVTISGYNKAIQTLDLTRLDIPFPSETDTTIAKKLGGYSINMKELEDKTRNFCSLDVSEFPIRYPKMPTVFHSITCLQLIYIKKLLTQFYLFDETSWPQIKFLLFPVEHVNLKRNFNSYIQDHDVKNDIGWALGLVLNVTSNNLNGNQSDIFYHHGSNVMFIMRSTLFLMFACVLFAISIIVFGVVSVSRSQRRESTYISHPLYGSSERPSPNLEIN